MALTNKGDKKEKFYTTGQAAKYLGISFPTVKRWIYSGRIKAAKMPSGWYRIAESELKRLKTLLEGKRAEILRFEKDVMHVIKNKKVAYLRELQVCLEEKYSHWDTYNYLNELVPKRLHSKLYRDNRWFFPRDVSWREVEDIADRKIALIALYSDHPRRYERRGVIYMDYSEYLVEQAMMQAGYIIVAKDAYYFHGIAYQQNRGPGRPKDLDFIAYIRSKNTYVGVQVKNKMEYPKGYEISELLDICNTLHLKPILVARKSHPMRNAPVINMGGRVIIFKRYFLQPPFDKTRFKEIVEMGIPLGVYKWTPEFLVQRFIEAAKAI